MNRVQQKIGLLMEEPIRLAGLRSVLEERAGLKAVTLDPEAAITDQSLTLLLVCLVEPAEIVRKVREIRSERPDLKTIVMSADSSEATMVRTITAGAKGFLDDRATPEQVMQCLDEVIGGSIWAPRRTLALAMEEVLEQRKVSAERASPRLTRREQDVVRLLAAARTNREIARRLGIEERTVKAYLAQLMRKVGVENRTALTMYLANGHMKGQPPGSGAK